MSRIVRLKPVTLVIVIGWLILVAAVYYYIYSSGWFNSTVSAVNEMKNFSASLIQEEGVRAAWVTIQNLYPSDESEQDIHTLIVTVDAPGICVEEKPDEPCLVLRKRIAAKALEEYPNIDNFTHLNIVVEHYRKILLVINLNTAFSDSRTIDEWREEIR